MGNMARADAFGAGVYIGKILSYKVTFRFIVILAGASAALAEMLSRLGGSYWFLDLFSHFKTQYLLVLCLTCLVLLFKRNYIISLIFGIFLLANLAGILPYYLKEKMDIGLTGRTLRLMHANVYSGNDRYDLLEKEIFLNNPDIIVLEEFTNLWLENLGKIKENYPFQILCPQEDNFGIAVFSKIPFSGKELLYWGEYKIPYIQAVLNFEGNEIFMIAVHTLPPVGKDAFAIRNFQLEDLATKARDEKKPFILVGDLNVTPWSVNFKKLMEDSGLKNSMTGFGVQPTWPSNNFLLWIPIDHCLVSAGLQVQNRKTGGKIGSDHYPLLIEMKLTCKK